MERVAPLENNMVYVWSEQQVALFAWVETGRGNAVVEAVAGAGKTTALVEAVRRMPGTVFLGAFNKKNVEDIKGRICGMPGKESKTFHSVGFGALRKAAAGRLEVDANKVRNIVTTIVHGTEYQEYARAAVKLVGFAKLVGFGIRELVPSPRRADWMALINKYDIMDGLEEDANPNRLMDVAIQALRASNDDHEVIDMDDMIYLPIVRGLRLWQYDWVLVDEVQDTSPTRRLLAAKLLKRGGRLVGVGDPHQAIYGFAGADSDSMELVRRDFKAVTLSLTVTYRCPKAVVAVARQYVGHITAAASAPEGSVGTMTYDEMLQFVVPGDAVLSRYTAPIVDLCFALIRAGKPAKIEGRVIGEGLAALAGRWKVKTCEALRGKLETWVEREREKALAKDDESKADRASDQYTTMICLIERANSQGITTVTGLQEMIKSIFDDVGASGSLVVLSSVHRSKGLEWSRVFVLGRGQTLPSPRVRSEEAAIQERNLAYVAVTRAKDQLVDVALPVNEHDRAAVSKKAA